MEIYTKVDQFTLDKFEELKNKAQDTPDSCLVPVIFKDVALDPDNFFNVEDGKLTMSNTSHKINFGFKFYNSKTDGHEVIPEMVSDFNNFIDDFRKDGIIIKDYGFFLCIDKMLYDLGYVGKLVLAQGVKENGDVSIYSTNYAENLINADDHEYIEYKQSFGIPRED